MEKYLDMCKGVDYIVSIPLKDFGSIRELDSFVQKAKEMNISCKLNNEQSNYYQGVLVEICDASPKKGELL